MMVFVVLVYEAFGLERLLTEIEEQAKKLAQYLFILMSIRIWFRQKDDRNVVGKACYSVFRGYGHFDPAVHDAQRE
jgi:hypothetical protein